MADRLPSSGNRRPLEATCHCGRIAITLPGAPEEIVECRCSLCYRLGALWAFYPRDEVTVTATSARPTTLLSHCCTSTSSSPAQGLGSDTVPITRGIVTAVDEALERYVRIDRNRNRNRGVDGNVTFLRCEHCGVPTHIWGLERKRRGHRDGHGDDFVATMGVNCRLLPESDISRAVRKTMPTAGDDVGGLGCETEGAGAEVGET